MSTRTMHSISFSEPLAATLKGGAGVPSEEVLAIGYIRTDNYTLVLCIRGDGRIAEYHSDIVIFKVLKNDLPQK